MDTKVWDDDDAELPGLLAAPATEESSSPTSCVLSSNCAKPAEAAAAAAAPVIADTSFSSRILLGDTKLIFRQKLGSRIGLRLYFASLVFAAMLEDDAKAGVNRWKDKIVVEIGAGLCGLPGLLLARLGAKVIQTDLPDIVQELAATHAENIPEDQRPLCLPLTWGKREDVPALYDEVERRFGVRHVDVVMGCDLVYHEHLFDILQQTLLDITDPSITGEVGGIPVVVVAHQKRGTKPQKFLKTISKYFARQELRCTPAIDFDSYPWMEAGMAELHSHSADADRWAAGPRKTGDSSDDNPVRPARPCWIFEWTRKPSTVTQRTVA